MKKVAKNTVPAVILAGGKGSRLRGMVDAVPKPMAPVNGVPFLSYLIKDLCEQGIKDIILSVGYKRDMIKDYYSKHDICGERLVFVEEEKPLGTAGALKNAEDSITEDTFLVMNGDSYCRVDYGNLIEYHCNHDGPITIVAVRHNVPEDFGSIKVDDNNRIIDFNEKISNGTGYINGGIYVIDKKVLKEIPYGIPYSAEYDLFPKFIDGRAYAYPVEGELIDIGTPERYLRAGGLLRGESITNRTDSI